MGEVGRKNERKFKKKRKKPWQPLPCQQLPLSVSELMSTPLRAAQTAPYHRAAVLRRVTLTVMVPVTLRVTLRVTVPVTLRVTDHMMKYSFHSLHPKVLYI